MNFDYGAILKFRKVRISYMGGSVDENHTYSISEMLYKLFLNFVVIGKLEFLVC